jgi:hypothetical protein
MASPPRLSPQTTKLKRSLITEGVFVVVGVTEGVSVSVGGGVEVRGAVAAGVDVGVMGIDVGGGTTMEVGTGAVVETGVSVGTGGGVRVGTTVGREARPVQAASSQAREMREKRRRVLFGLKGQLTSARVNLDLHPGRCINLQQMIGQRLPYPLADNATQGAGTPLGVVVLSQ